MGELALVGDHSTVPLTRISCNTVFSKSQNPRKAGSNGYGVFEAIGGRKNHGSSADQNLPRGYQEVVQNYQQSQVKFVLNERQGNKN